MGLRRTWRTNGSGRRRGYQGFPGGWNGNDHGDRDHDDGHGNPEVGHRAILSVKGGQRDGTVAEAVEKTRVIAVTGVAGPATASDPAPVGTMFIAVAGPDGCRTHRAHYFTDRTRNRTLATQTALDLLRRRLNP